MKSPFKFLDSYTKEDREIFFGREREIEELYHRVFESKIMLVYGISGTGKSSLIHCGLANKFQETDWLPLNIRRGSNIIDSFASVIKSSSITPLTGEISTPGQFKKAVRSLYLDHYKPIFFILDQFEELFIFGNKEEKKAVVQVIKVLVESEIQCRFIFVMREEYMAGITEFEKVIPTIFANRVRIEKMSHLNAIEAIKGPCKVENIDLEDGFAEALLEKLSPEGTDVELTYLQVFLDRILRLATRELPPPQGGQGGLTTTAQEVQNIAFTLSLLSQVGNVFDLLGRFLEEQISLFKDPQTGLSILKTFVSLKGTRKQLSETDIEGSLGTFGNEIPKDVLKEYLQQFITLRIIKDKNETGNYELRHDSLAEKIFGKITMMEKELLEVMNFLETANQQYEKRVVFLSEDDLKYIQYYEDKQILRRNKKFTRLIELSKKYHAGKKRKRRQIVTAMTTILIILLSILSIWAINQRSRAILQKNVAETQKNEAVKAKLEAQTAREEAEKQKDIAEKQKYLADKNAKEAIQQKYKADNARQIAENELYKNIKNSLSISAEAENVVLYGISNPILVTVSGFPSNKLFVSIDSGTIEKGKVKTSNGNYFAGDYIVNPAAVKSNQVKITVLAETKNGKLDSIGTKAFRVKYLPVPSAYFAGKNGGEISKASALDQIGVFVNLNMDFDIRFIITKFIIAIKQDSTLISYPSDSNRLTDEQKRAIRNLKSGSSFKIDSIFAIGPDRRIKELSPLTFIIK